MSEPIIRIEQVSKKYSRNAQQHLSYGIVDLLREVMGRKQEGLRKDEFYAVNDVSLEIVPGECLALIGRNGSGKTTLLKMLNGLVKPDRGKISIAGRVQALINLGAGFSPRLTGRENIFNSASLMGMSRRETNEVLGAIIAFSELELFIDSPVGTYSSGMKARLGFSVAIHLEPDILLIDEVLSVGDYAFQNKCFTRMEELKKKGVTIVFVSHSHASVIKLCEKAIWLHEGKIHAMGPSLETVQTYLKSMEEEDKRRHLGDGTHSLPEKQVDEPVVAVEDEIDDDPELQLGVSEPKVPEAEYVLPAEQESFVLSGWYKASSEKDVTLLVNGSPATITKVERLDVLDKFPDAPLIMGFKGTEHRETLGARNEVVLQVGGETMWKKIVLVDTPKNNQPGEARDSIYGPVYPASSDVDQIECRILVNGEETTTVPIHSAVTIQFSFRLKREVQGLASTLNFHRKDGLKVAAIASLTDRRLNHIRTGHVYCDVHIADFDFLPGPYVIAMPIAEGRSYLWRDVALEFYVEGQGQLYWGIKDIQHSYEIRVEEA